jgi:hypothetical protein
MAMNQTVESVNKALVLDAFDTLFNKREYAAAERYWSPHYIQHSAHIEPGREGLFNLVKSIPPTLKYEPGVILAGGIRDCPWPFLRLWRACELDRRRYRSSPRRDARRALGRDSGRGHAGTVKEWLAHVRRHISAMNLVNCCTGSSGAGVFSPTEISGAGAGRHRHSRYCVQC